MSGVRLHVRIAFEVTYDPLVDVDPEWYEGHDVDWLLEAERSEIAAQPGDWLNGHLSFDLSDAPEAATCPGGGISVVVEAVALPARARTGSVVHLAHRTRPNHGICNRRHATELPEFYVYSLCGQRDLVPLPIEYEASCRVCVRRARRDASADDLTRGWWALQAVRR